MKNRVDFVDWLKAVGMFLIVFGHYFGDPYNQFTQPIYPKQLGVAFFVFVMGWGLAKESRPHWQVVYNRLFPMYFWGISIAMFISAIYLLTKGSVALSNYAPFVLGFNVLLDYFPANPTTWYIGTYLHILLVWALWLRKPKITLKLMCVVLVCELLIRATLIDAGRLFNAYMLTTNWISVFLLGMYMNQQRDSDSSKLALPIFLGWAIYLSLWALLMNPLNIGRQFPLRLVPDFPDMLDSAFIAVAISTLYLSHTFIAVKLFSRIPANRIVRFFSRNTIIIFIGHMPLYDVAEPIARIFVADGWGKRAIIVFIMYVGLAFVSEWLHRMINVDKLKVICWNKYKAFRSA